MRKVDGKILLSGTPKIALTKLEDGTWTVGLFLPGYVTQEQALAGAAKLAEIIETALGDYPGEKLFARVQ